VLDERLILSRLPSYVTNSSDKLPSVKLDDGDLCFMLAKLDKMEALINNLQSTLQSVYAKLPATSSQPTAGPAPVVATDNNSIHPAAAAHQLATNATQPSAAAAGAVVAADRPTLVGVRHNNNKPLAADQLIARRVEAVNLTSTCDTSNDENDDFMLCESRRKQRRMRSKQQQEAQKAAAAASATDTQQLANPAGAGAGANAGARPKTSTTNPSIVNSANSAKSGRM